MQKQKENTIISNDNYRIYLGDKLLLEITKNKDTYTTKNDFAMTTAKVIPLNEYETQCILISNKLKQKNGVYRETKKLAQHNLAWIHYILEKYGLIRKSKPIK